MREWFVLAVTAGLCGCAAGPDPSPTATVPHAAAAAPASEFVHAQSERVRALRDFASRGSAEIHWKDEQGDHHEQTQLDLAWREGGGRVALRMDKLGERFAWSGADPQAWWVFRLESRPTQLVIGRRGDPLPPDMLSFLAPESLLELLGVTAWPQSARVELAGDGGEPWIRWERDRAMGAWFATRVRVPRPGALPTQVQLLDARNAVLMQAEHARPLSVEVAGLPPGAWPEVAGTTRFRLPERKDALWEVFWDAPGTQADRMKDRLFDLKVLRDVLHPDQVRDLRESSP